MKHLQKRCAEECRGQHELAFEQEQPLLWLATSELKRVSTLVSAEKETEDAMFCFLR